MWRELVRVTSTVCPVSVVLWVSENRLWRACGQVMRKRERQMQGKVEGKDRAEKVAIKGLVEGSEMRLGRRWGLTGH